jgi:hypothetical protein
MEIVNRAREAGGSAVARIMGLKILRVATLGLAPQALFCRPLRGLFAQISIIARRPMNRDCLPAVCAPGPRECGR